MDYAENFTCIAQDEIQSAHWNQAQVTLFTSVTWFRGKTSPHVVISDSLRHEKTSAVVFMDELLGEIHEDATEVRVWTDGPANQFKNKYVMSAIQPLSEKHGKMIVWNFSATSHGKGPVDGVGAALKRIAANGVKTRKINGAEDFHAAVKQSSVKTSLVTTTSIVERATSLNLDQLFEKAQPIKGIAQFHFIEPTDTGFATRRFSTEEEVVTPGTDVAEEDRRPAATEYVPEKDHVVAVKITGKRPHVAYVYMAQVR